VVDGLKFVSVTECDVTSEVPTAEIIPYEAVIPNSTWSVALSLVFHVIVAEVLVIAVAVTAEISGAPGAVVVKVKVDEVPVVPAEFTDSAR
jgi:hypothetical protein